LILLRMLIPMLESLHESQANQYKMKSTEGDTGEIKPYKTWPEKIASTLVDAFKLPGDVYQGKEDPLSDKGIGRAFELAGAVVSRTSSYC
jgi:hypothetical protein